MCLFCRLSGDSAGPMTRDYCSEHTGQREAVRAVGGPREVGASPVSPSSLLNLPILVVLLWG